jgi:uncharacterized protein (TIGR02099 family)
MPRAAARALRIWFPWVFAWAFVLLACGTLTGRLLTTQLDGAEASVAARIAAVTGFDVRIGRLRGRFLDWNPVLEIEGLSLSRNGIEVVAARRARIKADVLEALLRGRVVAAALVVEDLTVELERLEGGAIALRGGAGARPPDIEDVVSFLFHSDYVDLRDARFALYAPGADASAEPLARMTLAALLVGETFDHRGHLRATLTPAGGAAMEAELFVELDDEPLDRRRRSGSVLLELSGLDLRALSGLLGDAIPVLDGRVERARFRARVDPSTGTDFALRLSAEQAAIEGDTPVRLRNVRVDLDGHGRRLHDADLRIRDLDVLVEGEALSLDGARLAWRGDGAGMPALYGSAGAFDGEQLARLARSLELLDARADRWLTSLEPSARIDAIHFAVEPDVGGGAVALRARDISVRGYRGVPRVRGLDARAVVYEGGAWIDVDTDTFYLQFPDVFAEGWRYDAASGRVALRFDRAGLHLRSGLLTLRGPQGRAAGHVALFLPPDEAQRRISLALGIQGADAAFTEAFLPGRLEPELRDWLVSAVRAGRVDRGAVVINGAAKPASREERAFGLWFDFRAGRLAFDPAWPTATSLEGSVLVAGDGVRADLVSGRLAGLELGRTLVRVPRDAQGARVEFEGDGRGDGGSVLRFLRTVPLGDALAFLDERWRAVGAVDVHFDAVVPLDGGAPQQLEIDSELLLERLHVGQADLDLGDVSGRLSYRHPGILSSSDTRARLFDGPAEFRLAGNFAEGGEGLFVEGRGTADGRAIADWSGVDVLAGLAGQAPWSSRMRIQGDGAVELEVDSPAPATPDAGLVTNLPPPLAAPRESLAARMTVAAEGPLDLRLDWGVFSSRFEFVDGTFTRGALAIDTPLGALPPLGLSAVGHAPALDVAAWLETVERWGADAGARGDDDEAVADALLFDFTVSYDAAHWGEQAFGPAVVTLSGFSDELTLGFEAERLAGRLVIPDDERPLTLALDRLDLPLDPAVPVTGSGDTASATAETDEGMAALVEDLDPAAIPALDVVLASLSNDGEDLGEARFAVRSFPGGIRLQDVEAEGRGLVFGPDTEGQSRIELGLSPSPSTRVVGRLSGTDAERVLRRFGLSPSVAADAFAFDIDVAWEGLLDDPSLTTLSGGLTVDVARGRFNELDAGGGPLRMVGLLNVDAIARRMRLDFTDIYKRGIAFEEIEGALAFADGTLSTVRPLRIVGPQSRFVLTGELDLATRMLDGELVVTLPVSKNLPWAAAYAAVVANPLAGAGVFVAERLLRDAIDKYSSARYRISGTVDDPEVEFDTIFENELGRGQDDAAADPVPDEPSPGAGDVP